MGRLLTINGWEHCQPSNQRFDGRDPQDFAMCLAIFEEESSRVSLAVRSKSYDHDYIEKREKTLVNKMHT